MFQTNVITVTECKVNANYHHLVFPIDNDQMPEA